jgi:hypothetical protein
MRRKSNFTLLKRSKTKLNKYPIHYLFLLFSQNLTSVSAHGLYDWPSEKKNYVFDIACILCNMIAICDDSDEHKAWDIFKTQNCSEQYTTEHSGVLQKYTWTLANTKNLFRNLSCILRTVKMKWGQIKLHFIFLTNYLFYFK